MAKTEPQEKDGFGAIVEVLVTSIYVFPLGGRRIVFMLIIIIFLILVSPHFRSVNSNF